jgi:hypothetical protein
MNKLRSASLCLPLWPSCSHRGRSNSSLFDVPCAWHSADMKAYRKQLSCALRGVQPYTGRFPKSAQSTLSIYRSPSSTIGLIPCKWIHLQIITFAPLIKKLPDHCWPRSFITMFRKALSWTRYIRFTLHHPISLESTLILSYLSFLKTSIFWDITLCSPLKVNRRFG